jgi:hypothetical protein
MAMLSQAVCQFAIPTETKAFSGKSTPRANLDWKIDSHFYRILERRLPLQFGGARYGVEGPHSQ